MRVALTGASGFTGRLVADALSAAGVQCIPLVADLTDAAAVHREVRDNHFDRLIHLAAKAFVDAADWEGFYTVNQLGTFHLVDAVAKYRPGTCCILASSAQVYGPDSGGLITEDAVPRPANHYAVSKLAMEMGVARWSDRLKIVVARPFNYTGVGQEDAYLVAKLVDHFRRKASIIELGNTWVKRDFGDVRSVAEAYVGLALADVTPASPINIASGVVSSVDDLLTQLTSISGHTIDVQINPLFVRANDVPVLGGDITRLRAILPDWQPRKLIDTLTWMYARQS